METDVEHLKSKFPQKYNGECEYKLIKKNVFEINISGNNNSKTYKFVKQFRIDDKEPEQLKRILKEIYFTFSLKNKDYFPKNVEILSSKDKDYIFIVFTDNAISLKEIINKNFELKEDLIKWIIYQITFGLYYLHSNSIIHHNIKLSNIVINERGGISIIDYGSSIKKNEKSTSFNWQYASPEILLNADFDEKIDIWSLGITILTLYNKDNKLFFSKENNTMTDKLNYIYKKLYQSNSTEEYSYDYDYFRFLLANSTSEAFEINNELLKNIKNPEAKKLLKKLLSFNPKERLSAKEVLQSEYLSEFFECDPLEIKEIEYPFDYKEISEKNIDRKRFIELIEKLK